MFLPPAVPPHLTDAQGGAGGRFRNIKGHTGVHTYSSMGRFEGPGSATLEAETTKVGEYEPKPHFKDSNPVLLKPRLESGVTGPSFSRHPGLEGISRKEFLLPRLISGAVIAAPVQAVPSQPNPLWAQKNTRKPRRAFP